MYDFLMVPGVFLTDDAIMCFFLKHYGFTILSSVYSTFYNTTSSLFARTLAARMCPFTTSVATVGHRDDMPRQVPTLLQIPQENKR